MLTQSCKSGGNVFDILGTAIIAREKNEQRFEEGTTEIKENLLLPISNNELNEKVLKPYNTMRKEELMSMDYKT